MFNFAPLFSLLLIILTAVACAPMGPSQEEFSAWLEGVKREAAAEGISEATLNDAFADAQYIPRVIELDRKQPEKTQTIEEYLEKIVSDKRIKDGRAAMAEHKELLGKIGKEYHVAPKYIVALWGIETNYGRNTGGYSTISALATLAYDGRRSEFFRSELLKVLRIEQEDNFPASEIKGSWAGALGQCQFMPSSFLRYAVDYNKDGKRDIWNTQGDVFASIANYLHESGWDNSASLEDKHKVLMKWNRSRYFVTAVTQIAARLGSEKKLAEQ
jgi:membrane-bound lytic murein transglycosylase B